MVGDRRRLVQRAIGAVGLAIVQLMIMLKRRRVREISYDRAYMRDMYLFRLIYENDVACVDMLHVTRNMFFDLCSILRARGLVRDSIYVKVEEQVAMFLHTVGHKAKNRVLTTNFLRSGETVSRYFNRILYAIGVLREDYIRLPSRESPNAISSNSRFMPFFKDCVGALDGTHIRARIFNSIVSRFRGRKGTPTQNVLAAVGFDFKFQYVLAEWEGSAHDATVLKDALEREHGLIVPKGKYCLIDGGYATRPGFIYPYRRVRYHLNEFSSTNPPSNEKELFNHRHSSLRTTIERVFGMLKN